MTESENEYHLRVLAELYRRLPATLRAEPSWRRRLLVALVAVVGFPAVYVLVCSTAFGLTGLLILFLLAPARGGYAAEAESFGLRSFGTGAAFGIFTFITFVVGTKGPEHGPRARQDR